LIPERWGQIDTREIPKIPAMQVFLSAKTLPLASRVIQSVKQAEFLAVFLYDTDPVGKLLTAIIPEP
jgi:hypothetical protein